MFGLNVKPKPPYPGPVSLPPQDLVSCFVPELWEGELADAMEAAGAPRQCYRVVVGKLISDAAVGLVAWVVDDPTRFVAVAMRGGWELQAHGMARHAVVEAIVVEIREGRWQRRTDGPCVTIHYVWVTPNPEPR